MTTRILHFIDTLGAGGAERQLVYLLDALDRRTYEPHVLTTYDKFRHYESALQEQDIPVYSLHHGTLNTQNRFMALSRYVRLMWQLRPTIVHSWLHYPNLISRVARPLCPPHKLVTAIRSQYSPRQNRSESFTSWLSDFRIVNQGANDRLSNPHFLSPPTKHIRNGVPDEFLNTIKSSNKSQFTMLMPARIDPLKGHITLLNALSTFHDGTQPITLHMIGDVSDSNLQTHISETIQRYHLQNIVEQLPVTNHMLPHYKLATVTLVPSFSEGSSNVILESLATGTPVITSQAANQEGLVQQNRNGWVFPTGDSTALAKCIETALQTPQSQYIEMAIHCRISVSEFTVEHMVREHVAIYQRLIRRS